MIVNRWRLVRATTFAALGTWEVYYALSGPSVPPILLGMGILLLAVAALSGWAGIFRPGL